MYVISKEGKEKQLEKRSKGEKRKRGEFENESVE